MLSSMIREWGWKAEEADDGTNAVEAVHKKPYDAIFMDVRMTEMDGMEALGYIHEYNPAIPVIITTPQYHPQDPAQQIEQIPG